MKRRRMAFACVVLMLYCVSAGAQADSCRRACREPQGFRGIRWGESLSETANLKSIGTLDFLKYGDIFESLANHPAYYYLKEWKGKGYVNDRDILRIGYAEVSEIIYLFMENRFYGVVVESLGSVNRNELEKAVTAWMGSPTSDVRIGTRYVVLWEGAKVRVVLDYNGTMLASKRDIKLYIVSREMEALFIGF